MHKTKMISHQKGTSEKTESISRNVIMKTEKKITGIKPEKMQLKAFKQK